MRRLLFLTVALSLALSPWALAAQTDPSTAPAPPPPTDATISPATNPPPTSTPSTAPTSPPATSAAPGGAPAADSDSGSEEKTLWETVRLPGLFFFALLGSVLGVLNFLDARKSKARLTVIEADQLLDEAWDLLGGEPGTEYILSPATNRSSLESARRLIRDALKKAPSHSRVHRVESVYWQAKKKTGKRLEACHRAVETGPIDSIAHNNLGAALFDQSDLDAAIASYRRALELAPEYTSAHNNLGNALLLQGDLDAAIAAYRRALELDPDYAVAQDNLGIALDRQDRAAFLSEVMDNAARALGTALDNAAENIHNVPELKRAVKEMLGLQDQAAR